MQAIFQPILHNEKWWYVMRMAPHTKPLFYSLLPETVQVTVDVHNLPMDTDTTSHQRDNNRTHPSRAECDGSWVAVQLLHNDEAHAKTGSLLDADTDDVDESDPDVAMLEYGEASNADASVDLRIELDSEDMIDIDEETNIFLTIDIDPFRVIDFYADIHECVYFYYLKS
jgi:hypothetical protein